MSIVFAYLLVVITGCINPSLPVDLLMNLPTNERYDALRVRDAEPTLVVLQHGLWRSWGSLWRLQRALETQGYEVLNDSYSSTLGQIEEHAALLEERIEARLKDRQEPMPRLCFVGHSMGGLVIRSYLQRPGARKADTCVFVATPHRGAVLADLRKDGWLFKTFLGDKAALQLSPSSEFFKTLGSVPCASIATIVGSQGDEEGLNADIPGDDDGTVAVGEAHLPEETATVSIATGHTRLSMSSISIERVLYFLKHRKF